MNEIDHGDQRNIFRKLILEEIVKEENEIGIDM